MDLLADQRFQTEPFDSVGVREAKGTSPLPDGYLAKITAISSEIPFLMQEVVERFKLYGKEFSWTKFEFDPLRARINSLGQEIRDLHIEQISAIWAKTLGPLSEVVRPTKTQHSVDPMIEAFDVKMTSIEIVATLQNLHISANISKNPNFANLGVIVVPDDFFDGVDHDKRPYQTLITESEMQIREQFLREKVVLKQSDSDEFKAAIIQNYAKILTLKSGLAFLEKCCSKISGNKLPLVYSSKRSGAFMISKKVKIALGSRSHYTTKIGSSYIHYSHDTYLTLIHELQHCCIQDRLDKCLHLPTTCNFDMLSQRSTKDLWSNSLEIDAIATENKYRNFYPERIFHTVPTKVNLRMKFAFQDLIPQYLEKAKYNELNTYIKAVKKDWYFHALPKFKIAKAFARKTGNKALIEKVRRRKAAIEKQYKSYLYKIFTQVQEKWPFNVNGNVEKAFLKEQKRVHDRERNMRWLKKTAFCVCSTAIVAASYFIADALQESAVSEIIESTANFSIF